MATDGVASSGVAESSVNPGVSGVVALANGRRNPSGNVITQAVVSYLKDQGYEASALKLLEEDSTKRIPDSGSAKRQRTEDWGGTTSGPKASYAKLQEWLISSLDQFRDELWPVSWAVYVATFFRLIEEDKVDLAVDFRESFKGYHEHAHQQELSELRLVSTKQTLESSEFYNRFRENRFEVHLCKYSVDLLVSFLLANNLLFALSIVNEKISILERPSAVPPPQASCLSTPSKLPREAEEAFAGSRIVTGYSKDKVLQINSQTVLWSVPIELSSLYQETCMVKRVPSVPKTSKERLRQKRTQEHHLESCPPTDTEFFTTLCKYVVEPLRSGNLKLSGEASGGIAAEGDAASQSNKDNGKTREPESSTDKATEAMGAQTNSPSKAEKSKKVEGQISRAHSAKKLPAWPSIAFHTFYNSHDSLTCAEASVDSSVIVAGFDDSKLRLWQHMNAGFNAEAEKTIRATLTDGSFEEEPTLHSEDLIGHAGPVYGCSISRDARSLLSCSADGMIKLWLYLPSASSQSASSSRKRTRENLWFNVHNFRARSFATPVPIWDVKFSPVGHYFASASHDNLARLWDVEHSGNLRDFCGHISDVDCLAWHPNCHYLATGSSDKTVRLWDINVGTCARLFTGHVSGVSSVTVDSSGRYLVSAENSGLVFVWDLVAGKRLKILQGHRSPVWSLSCSPDGKFLATGSADTTVRIWETSHIWGRNSSKRETIDSSVQAKQHGFLANQVVRTFRTKFTSASFLRFQNERFILACGNFSLPLMT